MKPLDGTFAENAQKWGVAGLWIDGGRISTNGDDNKHRESAWSNHIESKTFHGKPYQDMRNKSIPSGRWPANLIHDGSDEVMAGFPKQAGAQAPVNGTEPSHSGWPGLKQYCQHPWHSDSGSAARFFYCAKASRAEREMGCEGMNETTFQSGCADDMPTDDNGKDRDRFKVKERNHHPTVKPLALMRYLVRLTKTPTGGIVLDPFMGSGTTGMACKLEGRGFIGIDNNKEYCEIAEKRIAAISYQPEIQELQV